MVMNPRSGFGKIDVLSAVYVTVEALTATATLTIIQANKTRFISINDLGLSFDFRLLTFDFHLSTFDY